MSWASHPTNEMPTTLATPGRHRRRRSSVIGISAAVILLVATLAGAMLSPTLLGWPPPSAPAAGAASPTTAGPDEPAPLLLLASAAPTATLAPSPSPLATTASTTPPARSTPPKLAATKRPTVAATGIGSLEDEVVRLTNTERASNGCVALRVDANLRTAARDHSAEMASRQKLTHDGANGSSPGDRMKRAGYNPDRGWAENVASGYPIPEAVMTGWMKSEGHRANILNCSLKAIGVGVARASDGELYWTQDFGGR